MIGLLVVIGMVAPFVMAWFVNPVGKGPRKI